MMGSATSVELHDLRWAIVASQHRSLRQAAEALNVRQSTLSRRLRSLESMLGVQLFQRTNGGTRPTIEGLEFLDAARRIVGEAETITARLKSRSRGESGSLTIGIHASLSAGNLRATLIEYRKRFPDVDAHLIDGSSDQLMADLRVQRLILHSSRKAIPDGMEGHCRFGANGSWWLFRRITRSAAERRFTGPT